MIHMGCVSEVNILGAQVSTQNKVITYILQLASHEAIRGPFQTQIVTRASNSSSRKEKRR